MSNGLEELQHAFKQLRLSEISIELPVLMREVEQKSWTYYELLNHLLKYELTKQEEKNKSRRLKWVKFPYQKTLEDYDLSEQTSLTERQMRQLKEMNWLEQQYNLILLGLPGVGKTHLAVDVGLEAIEQGYQVMFLPMGELTTILKTSDYTRKSQIALNRIKKSDLVIIDDLMYMVMDPAEANQFFQLVDYLYERSSIILTSNKSPDQWGELLGDEGVATAILDRLLHRVELIQMDDESYRMKHRQRVSTRKKCRILSGRICGKLIGKKCRFLLDVNSSPQWVVNSPALCGKKNRTADKRRPQYSVNGKT